MKEITILKAGSIVRTIKCRETSILSQLNEGETYIEGTFPSNLYKITEGAPVLLQDEERKGGNEGLSKVSRRELVFVLKAIRRDLRTGGTMNLNKIINRLENEN